MTGYTVHTGSTEKFSSGWDKIFAGKKGASQSAGTSIRKTAGKRRKKQTAKRSSKAGAAKAAKKSSPKGAKAARKSK